MRFLFSLLKRSRLLLLFILLEGIAFTIIFNQKSFQRSRFRSFTQEITGSSQQSFDALTRYLDLEVQNEYLNERNAQLQDQMPQAWSFQQNHSDTIGPDSTGEQRFLSIPARVISSSHAKRNNYLILNRGKLSQVTAGMGVASARGAVGIVKSVSRHFATVLPIINPQLTLTAKFKRTGYFGPLQWNGEDYRYALIEDIPRYADIAEGDTIITDSRSLVFPEGVMIGIAQAKELQSDQNFYAVKVKLAVDFSRLEHLYIIQDKLQPELDSLMQQVP